MHQRTLCGMRAAFVMLMLTLGSLFAFSSVAFADTATWIPGFSPNQHVQVDPALRGTVPDASIAAADAQLQKLGQQGNKQFFLVYTQHGDDQAPAGKKYAVWKLNQMVEQWQGQPGFSLDHYVVILVVHAKTGSGYSVAATGGNDLQPLGLDGNWFQTVTAKETKLFMPNDPMGFGVAMATDVNGAVAHYHFMHFWLPIIVVLALIFLAVLGWSLYWLSLARRADALIEKWHQMANNFSDWYDQLEKDNFGFLQQQAQWIATWTQKDATGAAQPNETLTRFKKAVSLYALLTARKLAVSDLYDTAVANRKRARYPLTGTFKLIIASFTTTRYKITGEKLSLEQAQVFGPMVATEELLPDEICSQMQEKFQEVNRELKAIADAFRSTQADSQATGAALAEADGLFPELTKRQLNQAPYRTRLTALQARVTSVQDDLVHNPLAAAKTAAAIRSDADALKADMRRGCSIADSLATTDGAISAAEQRAKMLRAQTVAFSYPFADGEQHPQQLAAQTYSLAEEHGNPDALTHEARDSQKSAWEQLQAANLDAAQSHKDEADRQAQAAQKLIDDVLAAKQFVEQHVQPVRGNLSTLRSEITPAQAVHAELRSDFLAQNWDKQSGNLATAVAVRDTTEGELAKVRAAYHEQRFLAAQSLLTSLGTRIQSARDGLVALAARLNELKGFRQHARDVAAQSGTLNGSLSTRLDENDFTTAQATIQLYRSTGPQVTALAATVRQAVADWPAAAAQADEVLKSLNAVNTGIDSQKQAYDLAKTRVSDLRGECQSAQETIDNPDTTQATRRQFSQATSALQTVQGQLRAAHSDWDAIGRAAVEAKELVSQAVAAAEGDHRQAGDARAQIAAARRRIAEVSGNSYVRQETIGGEYRTFGGGCSADVSNASSQLRAAEQYLGEQQYSQAASAARQAQSLADQANQAAIDEVAAAVATAVSLYEQAQEQAARQARLAQQRDDDDNGGGIATGGTQEDDSARSGGAQSDDSDRTGGTEQDFN